jgi:hypothetical protein
VWIFALELALFALFVLVWFVDVEFRKPRPRVEIRDFDEPDGTRLQLWLVKLLAKRCRLVRFDPDLVVSGCVERTPDGLAVAVSFGNAFGRVLEELELGLARRRFDPVAEHAICEALERALASARRQRCVSGSIQ